ncbi:transmembrane protein 254-like [Gigantopelta aegis]|uniref:transmembrane protein 254-like n=1 Tax=Gigantopelta aegis TaxID=1735272 RepID=UPI001B88B89A|nr:transmembrane protein 254-like [Gigantopelta aegis]
MEAKRSDKVDDNYFKLPHPFWIVSIAFGLWLLFMSTFAPYRIPCYLGPVCWIGRYMGTQYPLVCKLLCLGTVIIHCLEAAYAELLCLDKQLSMSASIKWTLQTLMFGFASLIRLKDYSGHQKLS